MHFWRVIEPTRESQFLNNMCIMLSWEWIYQGVSPSGMKSELMVFLDSSRWVIQRIFNYDIYA